MPVTGFLPMTGNMPIVETQILSYISGISMDMVNWVKADSIADCDINEQRFSLVNISANLLGLNYASFSSESKARFFNIAYTRIGPHYRFSGLNKQGRFAFGVQAGYGILLIGNTSYAPTSYQSGLDFSFTLTLTRF